MLKLPASSDRRPNTAKQKRSGKVYLYVGDEVRYAWDSPIDWWTARRALDWVRLHETEHCFLSNSADMPVGGKKTTKQKTTRNQSSADRVEDIDIRD